jgi:hypothetical protein
VPVTDGIGRQQSYDLLVELTDEGQDMLCTCPGFERARTGRCLHLDITLDLLAQHKL